MTDAQLLVQIRYLIDQLDALRAVAIRIEQELVDRAR